MRVLALEPYYGGSHKAFLDGWARRSGHDWTVLRLPAHKWKWRMRHSAVTFAAQVAEKIAAGLAWDVVFCSDMLPLAEFLGLAPPAIRRLPTVAYFHENQLTYPVRADDPRDLHFGFSNMLTALAARAVWFNSAFHRDEFLGAVANLLARMPDHAPGGVVDAIAAKSLVAGLGIEAAPPRPPRAPGPLRVLWAARWEHDKNPEDFFAAVDVLARRGTDFSLSVIGQQFRDTPDVFARAHARHADRIGHWGYLDSAEAYRDALGRADVIVSTANHEFFGLSVAEAVAAGAYPLLPDRLAYGEILALDDDPARREFFYDGSVTQLAERLWDLARRAEAGDLWQGDPTRGATAVQRFTWRHMSPKLDAALAEAASRWPV